MKRWMFALILSVIPLAAQQTEEPKPVATAKPPVVYNKKIFILKYADPRAMADLLRVFDVTISANPEMHVLAVTAPQATMTSVEEAISRLDTPVAATKNIEMTIQLVVGGDSESGLGNPVPQDLENVVTQLKNAFPFKTFRLLDTLTLRSRSGQNALTTSSGGVMKIGENTQPITTDFRVRSASIAQDGSTVRIDGLVAQTRMPIPTGGNSFQFQNLNMSTDLDIKEGQKVVVGRLGISHDQALFLVLTARVVN
jgi:hypothetical protein